MHIKKYLNNWFSQSIYARLILMILSFCSLVPNRHMVVHAQTDVVTMVEDSCKITDTSAYLWGIAYYRGIATQGIDINLSVNGEIVGTATQLEQSLQARGQLVPYEFPRVRIKDSR